MTELDPVDRELIQIVLHEPSAVPALVSRVAATSLRDPYLREILQTCYDLHGEGAIPRYEEVMLRLENPQTRALAAALTLSIESAPLPEDIQPAPWLDRLKGLLATLAQRERQIQIRELRRAMDEAGQENNSETYRALQLEYLRLLTQPAALKAKPADRSTRA